MIYGKIFASMFDGSLAGAGSDVIAMMAYVISHMQPDINRDNQEFVRLNVKLLSASIGETEQRMQSAIDFLCAPDAATTTEGEEGRRLVKVEPFVFRVVNGAHYRGIIDDADRKAKAAARQADFRERQKLIASMTPAQLAEYEAAKQKEFDKRRKPRIREMRKNGKEAGAKAAIVEGFKEARNGQ